MPKFGTKPVIGLLGGIGSGKSTIANLLAAEGCAVIDADQLAREALGDPDVVAQIVQWWGRDMLDARGQVDRRAVAKVVFDQPEQRRRLEGLIHPYVHRRREQLRRQHQADPAVRAVVEDCPLLIESGLDRQCDVLVYVQADLPTRQQRVAQARGWDPAELARREKTQVGLDIKEKLADHVIGNNADDTDSVLQVRRVLSKIFQH